MSSSRFMSCCVCNMDGRSKGIWIKHIMDCDQLRVWCLENKVRLPVWLVHIKASFQIAFSSPPHCLHPLLLRRATKMSLKYLYNSMQKWCWKNGLGGVWWCWPAAATSKTVHKSNQTGISRSNQSIEFVHFSGRHIQTNGIRPNFDPRVLDEQNYENNNSIITLNRKN